MSEPAAARSARAEYRERLSRLREALVVIAQAHPRNLPSYEEIACLHELHAAHEREHGREDRAAAAELRALRARERGARGLRSPIPSDM